MNIAIRQEAVLPRYSRLLDATELAALQGKVPSWWHEAHDQLGHTLAATEDRFPCIYAIRAQRNNTLRFVFLEDSNSDVSILAFADALSKYVKICNSLVPYTAFLAFFGPDPVELSVDENHAEFWRVLQRLHEVDPSPWPRHIPSDPAEPLWEFCFDGEPLFVLGSGPAHVVRRSRHTALRAISFQPRFMFDELIAAPELLARARRIIRQRVLEMDGIPVHPMIQMYHEEGNREWRQYVVPEDNSPIEGSCPFRTEVA